MKHLLPLLLLPLLLTADELPRTVISGRVNDPGTAPGGGCATSDTSLPHDEFLEGFQTATGGYNDGNSWTLVGESGTVANIDSYFDSSSLSTGKPDGACDRAWRLDMPSDGTETYQVYDRGSSLDVDSLSTDLRFYIYIESGPASSGQAFSILGVSNSGTPGTSNTTKVILENSAGNIRLLIGGVSTTVSINEWHLVHIHLDATTSSSYYTVDGGASQAFTRGAFDVRYLWLGVFENASAGETAVFDVDLISINTP